MGIHENEGKRIKHTVALTKSQNDKLVHLMTLFGITGQRFWVDCLEYFTMHVWDVASGRINISLAMKNSTLELLDDYIALKKAKGLTRPQFFKKEWARMDNEELPAGRRKMGVK